MELDEVWLSDEDYQRNIDYLLYSYTRIESELFSSFDYVPLRDENLNVSSMFFANICLRVYPILTIGFNTLTFGVQMKDKIITWKSQKEKGDFPEYYENIKIDEICKEIIRLKKKNLRNKDGIRDYFKFYKRSDLGIDNYFNINNTVEPLYHLGRIEYNEKIQPFDDENFNKYINTRNAIEHRGQVEASLKEAYNAVSALNLVVDTFARASRIFKSMIFGQPYLPEPLY